MEHSLTSPSPSINVLCAGACPGYVVCVCVCAFAANLLGLAPALLGVLPFGVGELLHHCMKLVQRWVGFGQVGGG